MTSKRVHSAGEHAVSLLTITDLTLRIAGRVLLDNASLNVDPGRKIGLIGRNGAGKSTLLAAIAGDLHPMAGPFSSQTVQAWDG